MALEKAHEVYTAYTLTSLAELSSALGDYASAGRLLEDALRETQAGGNDDVFIQRRTTLGLGDLALDRADFNGALEYHRKRSA